MRKNLLYIAVACSLSASAAQPNDTVNAGLYRLFAPLTFYHNVSAGMLAIDSQNNDADDAVDRALMNVYLNRPDLVEATETQLEETGSLREDINLPIAQTVELVDHVAPMPEDPEVVPAAEVEVTKPNFWKYKGDGYLQFMQNYVSGNWYKGGESNYSAVGSLTLEANYDNKSKWKWENKLEMKLGFQTSRTGSIHRFKANEDLIRYTGKIGLQAAKRWYYTLQVQAQTQFSRGFKANDQKTYSDFMSPFDLSVGLGMDYKVEWLNKKMTGTINISPLAMNYRFVDRSIFNDTWFPTRYGIDADKHHKLDFGSQLTASLEWKINENVTWKTRLYAFTSYHRAMVEWENTFSLRVSKYISANLFLFPRYDDANTRDEDLGYWQFKEYSSLGFSYNF